MESVTTLCSAFLGGFDFEPVEETAGNWGRLYLMSYLLFIMLVIGNLYVSLVNEYLAETMGDSECLPKDYEVVDYILESLRSLVSGEKSNRGELKESDCLDGELNETDDMLDIDDTILLLKSMILDIKEEAVSVAV